MERETNTDLSKIQRQAVSRSAHTCALFLRPQKLLLQRSQSSQKVSTSDLCDYGPSWQHHHRVHMKREGVGEGMELARHSRCNTFESPQNNFFTMSFRLLSWQHSLHLPATHRHAPLFQETRMVVVFYFRRSLHTLCC